MLRTSITTFTPQLPLRSSIAARFSHSEAIAVEASIPSPAPMAEISAPSVLTDLGYAFLRLMGFQNTKLLSDKEIGRANWHGEKQLVSEKSAGCEANPGPKPFF